MCLLIVFLIVGGTGFLPAI